MININFEDILSELRFRVDGGVVDLTKENQVDELYTILKENGISDAYEIAQRARVVFGYVNEGKPKTVSQQAHDMKLVGKGGTAYGPEGNDVITHHNKDGKLVKLDKPKKVDTKTQSKAKEPAIKGTPVFAVKPQLVSFKDALFSTAKKKKDDQKNQFIEAKNKAAIKTLSGIADKSGNINLLDSKGKTVKIKAKDVANVINKMFKGENISKSEAETFNKVCKLVTNPDSGTVKIYFAKKMVGRHPQQGYDSIEIAGDNLPMVEAVRQYALKNKLNVGKSSEGAIGKKMITPTKMASSVNPKEPVKTVEIKQDKDGISIGGIKMTKKKIPNEQNLSKALSAKYGVEEGARQAKLIVTQTEAYNQRLDDLATAAKNSKPPGKIPMTNFGDVKSPKERKKTINNILEGTFKRFESELNKYSETFGKGDLLKTPENKAVFDSITKLKKLNSKSDLEASEKDKEQYKSELDNLLLNMANAPDFADSVADFAEIKVGLQFLAEGKQVYFPASENFQTADVIVMPDEFNVKPKKGQTLEQAIAENLQFYAVSVTYAGGLSVKYKGGGGSANYSKISQTEYKNKETQKKLLEVQSVYRTAYPKNKDEQLNIPDKAISADKKKLEDLTKWAVKAGICTNDDVKKLYLVGRGKAKAILEKSLKNVARCKGANRKNFEQAVELHHIMMQLTAFINNTDVKYTRFSNFNQEVSQNKEGKATKVKDDIADGVSKPCYMNPHHNPGFSTSEDSETGCVTGTPTNQNPSHIESSPPKNLLKV